MIENRNQIRTTAKWPYETGARLPGNRIRSAKSKRSAVSVSNEDRDIAIGLARRKYHQILRSGMSHAASEAAISYLDNGQDVALKRALSFVRTEERIKRTGYVVFGVGLVGALCTALEVLPKHFLSIDNLTIAKVFIAIMVVGAAVWFSIPLLNASRRFTRGAAQLDDHFLKVFSAMARSLSGDEMIWLLAALTRRYLLAQTPQMSDFKRYLLQVEIMVCLAKAINPDLAHRIISEGFRLPLPDWK